MKIKSTKFRDLKIIYSEIHKDTRGFSEKFAKKRKMEFASLTFLIKKMSKFFLNFQKYLTVLKGEIFDVAIDLGKKSKTFETF